MDCANPGLAISLLSLFQCCDLYYWHQQCQFEVVNPPERLLSGFHVQKYIHVCIFSFWCTVAKVGLLPSSLNARAPCISTPGLCFSPSLSGFLTTVHYCSSSMRNILTVMNCCSRQQFTSPWAAALREVRPSSRQQWCSVLEFHFALPINPFCECRSIDIPVLLWLPSRHIYY